jgi:hypothetical protein
VQVWARAIFSTGQPDFVPSASLGECEVGGDQDGYDTVYGGCTVDVDRLRASTGVKAEAAGGDPKAPTKINW